jgi:hypothetical protein
MVLQSSGAISMNNIQTEFGGVNPIGLNEYYLNGAYTTGSGASGIPTSGAISLGSFYGKSKIVEPLWPPTAVQSSFGNFGIPWSVGNTGYNNWLTGASGTNLTRTGGSTFNNLGFDNYRYRPNLFNYQNYILQAKPGDTVQFLMQYRSFYFDYTYVSVLLNLGGGWFVVSSQGGQYAPEISTRSADYTISSSQAVGSYGIAVYCDLSYPGNGNYSSANFYSLHIAN